MFKMTKEKPRTHRKQDDKYFEGLTKEKALSEEKEKCYTGDIIEGCEEWYYHLPLRKVNHAVDRLKESLCKEYLESENIPSSCLDRIPQRHIIEQINEIFGDLK